VEAQQEAPWRSEWIRTSSSLLLLLKKLNSTQHVPTNWEFLTFALPSPRRERVATSMGARADFLATQIAEMRRIIFQFLRSRQWFL
jgi:hypothetical protein